MASASRDRPSTTRSRSHRPWSSPQPPPEKPVEWFDTAAGGNISYQRGSITVAPEVATAISNGQAVVVIHGVDYNKDGKYDGDVKSDLDRKLPTEATDPALCGALRAAPTGGMAPGRFARSGLLRL